MNLKSSLFKWIPYFCFSVLFFFFGSANASTAYTIDGYNDSTGLQTLYSIDTNTGAVTAIGYTGQRISDIAWDRTSGRLYGAVKSRSSRGVNGLVTINTNTGVATFVNTWKNSAGGDESYRVTQIDIDSNGNMYGSDKGGRLIQINASNAVVASALYHTVIAEDNSTANVGLGRFNLSFDNSDNLWRNIGQSKQYVSTDLANNMTSPISATPNSNGFGYAYDGGVELEKIEMGYDINGTIFQLEVDGRHGSFDLSTGLFWILNGETIYKFNMVTGEIVGTLRLIEANVADSFSVNQGIRGLAFVPVPLPAAMWIFGSALLGLFGFTRNRDEIFGDCVE